VPSRKDRRAPPQSKRAQLGFLSDIQHAAVAYTFVWNVLERSWVETSTTTLQSYVKPEAAAGAKQRRALAVLDGGKLAS